MIGKEKKLTLIEWVDSYSVYEGWDFIKELAEPKVMKCLSVGWILKETEECILLMPHISGTNDNDTLGAGMGGLSIPKVAITNRKEFEYE